MKPRIKHWAAGALLGTAGIAAVIAGAASFRSTSLSQVQRSGPTATDSTEPPNAEELLLAASQIEDLRPKVTAFCGHCHAAPDPGSFPREAWFDEVERGFQFFLESREPLSPPPFEAVVAFYRSQAPVELDLPGLEEVVDHSSVRFTPSAVRLPESSHLPAVSHLHWQPGPQPRLFFTDMGSGDVGHLSFAGPELTTVSVARLSHPAHLTPTDLDGDAQPDFLVAELGSFRPGDHQSGQVIWLRPTDGGTYERVVLQQGLGRVADIQPGDFDGNGDLDLVVAEFGWQKTGRLLLLRRSGARDGVPLFESATLDERHGAIHVPPADLNGDGQLDFVALISQEHEAVEAFLNRGDGTFQTQRIFEAGDPSYGSSGIQLVDLDSDGDLDVLYTNGDTLDSKYLKPYHAVHWLENRGRFPFVHHMLAPMPGVSRAIAGDLDGDGDLDIVATASIPASLLWSGGNPSSDRDWPTLLWLEQIKPGRFAPRVLPTTPGEGFLALDVGDFDGDGDLDLATGSFATTRHTAKEWLTVWWNQTITAARNDSP